MGVVISGEQRTPDDSLREDYARAAMPRSAYTLAIIGLQSDLYQNDVDFRDAVDAVLALARAIPGATAMSS